jgi:hypothetical protein
VPRCYVLPLTVLVHGLVSVLRCSSFECPKRIFSLGLKLPVEKCTAESGTASSVSRSYGEVLTLKNEQEFLGLLVGAWIAIVIAVLLIFFHSIIGRSSGNNLMGEACLVGLLLELSQRSARRRVRKKVSPTSL